VIADQFRMIHYYKLHGIPKGASQGNPQGPGFPKALGSTKDST
jgi:hypothetical protein